MRNLLKAILPLVSIVLLVSCSADSETTEIPTATTSYLVQDYNYTNDELALLDQINEYRETAGLNRLEPINHISYKAEEHNQYMISANAISHDYFQERSQNLIDVLGATKVSENVAYNYSTPNAVLHAWLESPAHKANIEGDFTHFGLSVTTNPENGNKFYTNIFIKK